MSDWPVFSLDGRNTLILRNSESDVRPSIEPWKMPSLTDNAVRHWARLAQEQNNHIDDTTAVVEPEADWLMEIYVGVALLVAQLIPALIGIILQLT